MQFFFVRIGSWGEIVRCRVGGGGPYRRGTRVICRTTRGLEVGQVTAEATETDPIALGDETSEVDASTATLDGPRATEIASLPMILRATTAEDELLIARLERYRRDAMEECRRCLAAAGSSAVLLEVDQVFDAGTLIFYFLSDPDPSDQQIVQQLAERYESKVRSGHFAKLLAKGCGPSCGTQDCSSDAGTPSGCSGTCAVCLVAAAKKR